MIHSIKRINQSIRIIRNHNEMINHHWIIYIISASLTHPSCIHQWIEIWLMVMLRTSVWWQRSKKLLMYWIIIRGWGERRVWTIRPREVPSDRTLHVFLLPVLLWSFFEFIPELGARIITHWAKKIMFIFNFCCCGIKDGMKTVFKIQSNLFTFKIN